VRTQQPRGVRRLLCVLVGSIAGCAAPAYEFGDAPPCPSLGAACTPVPGDTPAITAPVVVAPSAALPPEVVSQVAHNNLDIAWHRGRLYFAFRTAPYHFASAQTMLYVVSTDDHEHWVHEASFAMGTDLREPRFLPIGDRLFLYFAVLGDYLATFEPKGTMVSELVGPAAWSTPVRILDDGFIAWRTRSSDGVPSLLGYTGGESIYQPDGEPVRVSWLTTTNARDFTPAAPEGPVVLEGGSSETDLARLDDGTIVAVSRNELGDELGWGSKICRADGSTPGTWTCVGDPKKYDSPLVFRHGDEVYLIGRRNVTETGNYDLMDRDQPRADQTSAYELAYWLAPKRCALWRVDPQALAVTHVLDLPSSGDTCFAGLVELGGGRYLIYDYSSPIDADVDRSWMSGQFGPTSIHWLTLTLPSARP